MEKESYINNKIPDFEKYNISSISKDIVAQKFKNYIYKNKNFNTDKTNLSSEIELNQKDVSLLREQLNIKIKLEQGKKKLFNNNVGSLMDSLVSTDQRISLSRELQTKLNTIQSLKLKRKNISDEKNSYLNELSRENTDQQSKYEVNFCCQISSLGLSSLFAMISPTSLKACSSNPLVVRAAEPRLSPLVTNGDSGSKGTVFLFAVILISLTN